MDVRGGNYGLLTLADIKAGDRLKVFGLKPSACDSNVNEFVAFVIVVAGP